MGDMEEEFTVEKVSVYKGQFLKHVMGASHIQIFKTVFVQLQIKN